MNEESTAKKKNTKRRNGRSHGTQIKNPTAEAEVKEVKKASQKKKNINKEVSSAPAQTGNFKKIRPPAHLTSKAFSADRRKIREELIKEANEYFDGARDKFYAEKTPVLEQSGDNIAKAAPIKKNKNGKKKAEKPVKILFFGGVGEIGKNMTAIEYGDDIIVIDAGVSFPDEAMPGVDLVIPDASYLIANKDKIKGILITHGHEDHIGGIPYLLKEINPDTPIYATKLTLALTDNKIKEHRIQNAVMKTQAPGDVFKVGCFDVEFINVNHSITGAVALAINTPHGLIYHSGDFKIDLTPVAGESIDLARISELGKNGVLLYLGESTNIERAGFTMSETVVGSTMDHLFSEHASRRIIIATFASNVHRLKQIIDVAIKYKRKVALSGRSMLNVVEAATRIGELSIPEGVLVDIDKIKNYADSEIAIISTGSQGEPMSALTRMANGEFNKVVIDSNDTVIISASPIPGNEKMIYRVINNLYKKGAEVIYESLQNIHVSGHACVEEHKIMHNLLKPKYFIPVHGEYRHLKRHTALAEKLGMNSNNVLIPDVGSCVELTSSSMRFGDNFSGGVRIIDGSGSEDFSTSEVMKDRRKMSNDGLFVVSMCLTDGVIINGPTILNKGVLLSLERDYESEMLNVVKNVLAKYDLSSVNVKTLSNAIEKGLKDYLYKKTKQSPMILPIIMEM